VKRRGLGKLRQAVGQLEPGLQRGQKPRFSSAEEWAVSTGPLKVTLSSA